MHILALLILAALDGDGLVWLYSLIFYIPLDIIKFTVRYALSGEAWNLVFDRKVSATVPCFILIRL